MVHANGSLQDGVTTEKWRLGSVLFAELGDGAIERLASLAQAVKYDAGQVVFMQDDPGDALYMVERGNVEISVTSVRGKKLSLNIMCSGDVFGEIAVLDGGARTATATTLDPTTLLRIKRSDVLRLFSSEPEFAADMVSMLCTRLRWVSLLVEDLGLHGIEARLASRLIILDRRYSDANGNVPLSQNELADFLGVTRESINKALRKWEDEGLIGLSRGSVRILNHARLAGMSSIDH